MLFGLQGRIVQATDLPYEKTETSEREWNTDDGQSVTITDEKIAEYLNEDGTIDRKKVNLLVQVFLSADDEVAKEELQTLYFLGFWQSAAIPLGEGIGFLNVWGLFLSLLLLSFIATVFLLIGTIVSFTTLVLIKLTSGGTIPALANMLQSFLIDTVLFKTSDGTPLGIRLISLLTLFGLIVYAIQQKKIDVKDLLQKCMSFIVCAFLVGTLSMYTLEIHDALEEKVSAVTSEIFEMSSDKPKEIEEKALAFHILQVQPFLMRNFGVSMIDDIQNKCSNDETGQEQFERLLLNDNSKTGSRSSYAEYQSQVCGNTSIKHTSLPLIELSIFIVSMIGGISTILLSVSISIVYLFRLAIVFIIAFRPTVVIFGLLKKLWALDFQGIGTVLLMSVLWMVAGSAASLAITIAMQMLIKTINMLAEVHPLLNLFLGFILLTVAIAACKHWRRVIGAIKGAVKHAFAMVKDGLQAETNPFDSFNEHIHAPLQATGNGVVSTARSIFSSDKNKPIKTKVVDDAEEDELDIDLENEIEPSEVVLEDDDESKAEQSGKTKKTEHDVRENTAQDTESMHEGAPVVEAVENDKDFTEEDQMEMNEEVDIVSNASIDESVPAEQEERLIDEKAVEVGETKNKDVKNMQEEMTTEAQAVHVNEEEDDYLDNLEGFIE